MLHDSISADSMARPGLLVSPMERVRPGADQITRKCHTDSCCDASIHSGMKLLDNTTQNCSPQFYKVFEKNSPCEWRDWNALQTTQNMQQTVHSSIHIAGKTKHSYEHVIEASMGSRTKVMLDLSSHQDVALHAAGYRSASSAASSVGGGGLGQCGVTADGLCWTEQQEG